MSAHISQRSFLYGEGFFHNRADTDKQKKQTKKKQKQQQIRGRKMRKDIKSGGWKDYREQCKVWQPELQMSKVLELNDIKI